MSEYVVIRKFTDKEDKHKYARGVVLIEAKAEAKAETKAKKTESVEEKKEERPKRSSSKK